MKTGLSTKKGYSLVEIVIYVSILAVFFIIIIDSLLSFTKSYREVISLRIIERSGLDSMERMTRDIRSATTVDLINSTLNSNPGVLSLVATYNGFSTTTSFYLQNGVLKVNVNGIYQGPLSAVDATVTGLIFRRFSNGSSNISSGIKIDMTIEASVGSTTKSKKYYSTVILKG